MDPFTLEWLIGSHGLGQATLSWKEGFTFGSGIGQIGAINLSFNQGMGQNGSFTFGSGIGKKGSFTFYLGVGHIGSFTVGTGIGKNG